MHSLSRCMFTLLLLAAPLAGCAPITREAAQAASAQAGSAGSAEAAYPPRTVLVRVGAGQDTAVANAFLPSAVRVRAGDTVTWQLVTDEIHTVSFLGDTPLPPFVAPVPGGAEDELMEAPEVVFPTRAAGEPVEHYTPGAYVNSGFMDKTPEDPDLKPSVEFSLTFDEPGLYPYLCQIHPYMRGAVAVEPATTATVADQEEIDRQAGAEGDLLLSWVTAIKEVGQTPRSDTLADGSHVWYVDAGANNAGDPSASAYEFMVKDLTVDAGDTVVWASHDFHSVTFAPVPPDPFYVVFKPQPEGQSLRVVNPQVLVPAKPSQVYDPAQYYNSGLIGPGMPDGSTWSLTFEEPGTYRYRCAVHGDFGMEGTIIVR